MDSYASSDCSVRKSQRVKIPNDKYHLRDTSIVKREETQERICKPKQLKPKSKPAPLSKYRRRTANARERDRMREMNEAFEELRQVVPDYPEEENSKVTKMVTLQLAVNYIKALRTMLGFPDLDDGATSTSGSSSAPYSGSDGEACLSPSDQSLSLPESSEETDLTGDLATFPWSSTDLPDDGNHVLLQSAFDNVTLSCNDPS